MTRSFPRRPLALLLSALAVLSAPALAQSGGGSNDEVVWIEDEDPEMSAAIAEARETLPEWLAVLESPPPGTSDITFKYPLEGYEHIWVGNVSREGDMLHGRLANLPDDERHMLGEEVSVPLSDVSDWAYRDAEGTMHGYRTLRPLLKLLDPEQGRAILEDFGWSE